ncbi:hypothetical protein HK105_209139 [Polyrhizophydium stewartii]|uniref:Uncharacterized protein n=1 Tax=Polyrhizophydium stewartii TaxID=2732419 RepID=A0ABR4MVW9_9FUNG
MLTVKDVFFMGGDDAFVASGSDDGEVVNLVQRHPFDPMIAVSGIDNTIKILEPVRPFLDDVGASAAGSAGDPEPASARQRARRAMRQVFGSAVPMPPPGSPAWLAQSPLWDPLGHSFDSTEFVKRLRRRRQGRLAARLGGSPDAAALLEMLAAEHPDEAGSGTTNRNSHEATADLLVDWFLDNINQAALPSMGSNREFNPSLTDPMPVSFSVRQGVDPPPPRASSLMALAPYICAENELRKTRSRFISFISFAMGRGLGYAPVGSGADAWQSSEWLRLIAGLVSGHRRLHGQPRDDMGLSALDVVALSYSALVVVLSLVQLRSLLALPPSLYSRLVVALSLSIPVYMVGNALRVYVPALHGHSAAPLGNVPISINVTLGILMQFEFLRLLAPLLPIVPPRALLVVQVVAGVLCAVYVATGLQPLLPESWRAGIEVYWHAFIWLLGAYDTTVQAVLLHFVVTRLRGAPHSFKRRYMAIIGLAMTVLVVAGVLSVLTSVSDLSPVALVYVAMGPTYELCALMSMLQLRAVLAEHARRAHAPLPHELRDDLEGRADGQDAGKTTTSGHGLLAALACWFPWRRSKASGSTPAAVESGESVGAGTRVQPPSGTTAVGSSRTTVTAPSAVDAAATLDGGVSRPARFGASLAASLLSRDDGGGSTVWSGLAPPRSLARGDAAMELPLIESRGGRSLAGSAAG